MSKALQSELSQYREYAKDFQFPIAGDADAINDVDSFGRFIGLEVAEPSCLHLSAVMCHLMYRFLRDVVCSTTPAPS